MAFQTISPTAHMWTAPFSGRAAKVFIEQCKNKLSKPLKSPDHYGLFSRVMGEKIYAPTLLLEHGFQLRYANELRKIIVKHSTLMGLEKHVYFIPQQTHADMMLCGIAIQDLAKQVADLLGVTIFVHFGIHGNGYRLGEVRDDEDKMSLIGLMAVTVAHPHDALNVQGIRTVSDESADLVPGAAVHTGQDSLVKAALANRKQSKSRAKKNSIPKPPNAWIVYLNDHYKEEKQKNSHLKCVEISKIIGAQWQKVNGPGNPIGDHYRARAAQAKTEHVALYGEYKVKPRKSSEIKRRQAKKFKALISIPTDCSHVEDSDNVGNSEFTGGQNDLTFASHGGQFSACFDPQAFSLQEDFDFSGPVNTEASFNAALVDQESFFFDGDMAQLPIVDDLANVADLPILEEYTNMAELPSLDDYTQDLATYEEYSQVAEQLGWGSI